MPSSKVIQLRQALSEKFPGLRLHLDDGSSAAKTPSPDVSSPIEELLQTHRAKGELDEIVAGETSAGSATLIRGIIHRAAERKQVIALVDGCDSFEATQMTSADLTQLLWVRCPDAEKALQAADLLLRDGNLPLVILDLKFNPESQLRKIPATIWYRFQRLVETNLTSCLIFTPRPMVAPAKMRFNLHSHFSLADLEREPSELLPALKLEPSEKQQFRGERKIA